jgi:uncharacterized protein YjbJ (UPF0337 family)
VGDLVVVLRHERCVTHGVRARSPALPQAGATSKEEPNTMSEGNIYDKAKDVAGKVGDAAGAARDKVGDVVGQHQDKIEGAVEKVGDFVDDKTGGRFSDQIDKVQDVTKGAVDKIVGEDDEDDPDQQAADAMENVQQPMPDPGQPMPDPGQ